MKKIVITLFAALSLYACKQDPSYTITGKAAQPELEGQQILLNKISEGKMVAIDSAIITKGNYQFKGHVEQPEVYFLQVLGPTQYLLFVQLIVENSTISVTSDTLGNLVTGTVNNDLLYSFINKEKELRENMNQTYVELQKARDAKTTNSSLIDSLQEKYGQYYEEKNSLSFNFVKTNINNPAGQSQLSRLITLPKEKLKELIAGADSTALKTPAIQEVAQHIQALEKTAVGQPYIDLHMNTPTGEAIALSNFVGKDKYVLIDFWASWCGPCRHEIPQIVEVYKKYKDKGFEIVGISLDTNKDAWIKGIKDLKMEWPQMSDLKGGQSEAGKQYAISGIPHTILIDKNGIIIAKNLHSKSLEKKLQELMSK